MVRNRRNVNKNDCTKNMTWSYGICAQIPAMKNCCCGRSTLRKGCFILGIIRLIIWAGSLVFLATATAVSEADFSNSTTKNVTSNDGHLYKNSTGKIKVYLYI